MVEWPNVIQAELFHTTDAKSLEELERKNTERICEGLQLVWHGHEASNGIKTVVRFYDTENYITNFVLQFMHVERRCGELGEAVLQGSKWLQKFRDRRHRAWVSEKLKLRQVGNGLVVAQFALQLHDLSNVAVEKNDHTFRPARADEMQELVEAMQAAKSVWIFVFKHNDLLSDQNTLIARLM